MLASKKNIHKAGSGRMVDWSMAIQLHTETWIAMCLFCAIFGFAWDWQWIHAVRSGYHPLWGVL